MNTGYNESRGGCQEPDFLGEGNWGQDHKRIVTGTQANICKSRKNLDRKNLSDKL